MKMMKMNYRTVALITSVLFALAFVMPVFLWDRTLIWDDWIWIHNSTEQLHDVAIQLGFWWLADVNVFIYSLKNPNLFLALLGFISHVITTVVLGKAFVRTGALNDIEAGFWMACCIVTPYLSIGYTNSVAFYNLYFACFTLAAYLFAFYDNKFVKLLAVLLFLFSFSLNSLMPAYLGIVIFSNKQFLTQLFLVLENLSFKSSQSFVDLYKLIVTRITRVWLFMLLPFIFYVIKMASPYSKNTENPYELYNVPQVDSLLWAPLATLRKILGLTTETLYLGIFGNGSLSLILGAIGSACAFVGFYLLRKIFIFPTHNEVRFVFGAKRVKAIGLLFCLSFLLIFPYILVGKPPMLGHLLEVRHFIPSQPFIFAIVIMAISAAAHILGRIKLPTMLWALMLFSIFTAFSTWRALVLASNLWWENKTSNYIIEKIKTQKTNIKLWVFDSNAPEILGMKRWNYVYTGYLISAFGTKDHFGIARDEYLEWNQPVKLLNDAYFKHRYNIENYIHQDSYNDVKIQSLKEVSTDLKIVMYILEMYGIKRFEMSKFISINLFAAYGCVDEIVSLVSGEENQPLQSADEQAYCRLILAKTCEAITSGSQIIRLNAMEYAYALQRYPTLISKDGLPVFGPQANFKHIEQACASGG